MTIITLTPFEIKICDLIAADRVTRGQRYCKQKYGLPKKDVVRSIIYNRQGAQAEMAVAKMLNRYYDSGGIGTKDVSIYQVRSTPHSWGGIILHADDCTSDAFILVHARCPKFHVRGWVYGWEAVQEKYLRKLDKDRPKEYVVMPDAEDFHLMSSLPGDYPNSLIV